MKSSWIIAKRELASYFDSLTAYILIILFLSLSGLFTWIAGANVFVSGQANLQQFFSVAYIAIFFFTAAVTMRTLAEEKRSGSIELLSAKPVSDWDIVIGKFLSCFLLVAICILCTIPYYFTINALGDVDHGGVIGGYLGLLLLSAMYISIGIFASSLTTNQIVAFLLTILIGVFFHWLFGVLTFNATGTIANILHYLNAQTHFESLSRGVLDVRDLVYFFSIIFISLMLAQAMLAKRNWQN